jgi:protein PhnA
MSETQPTCPKCQSVHAYQDRSLWICPECFHEWDPSSGSKVEELLDSENDSPKFLDANGEQLQNGDTVATVKELKLGKDTLKAGTKVKNIRLLDVPVNGHDISCKIPEQGSMYLKCSVVKKVK